MKKIKTLNLILGIVAVLLVVFIAVMVVTFWKFQAIPDTLVTCVLGTGSAELLCSALIEICKKKFSKSTWMDKFMEEQNNENE